MPSRGTSNSKRSASAAAAAARRKSPRTAPMQTSTSEAPTGRAAPAAAAASDTDLTAVNARLDSLQVLLAQLLRTPPPAAPQASVLTTPATQVEQVEAAIAALRQGTARSPEPAAQAATAEPPEAPSVLTPESAERPAPLTCMRRPGETPQEFSLRVQLLAEAADKRAGAPRPAASRATVDVSGSSDDEAFSDDLTDDEARPAARRRPAPTRARRP